MAEPKPLPYAGKYQGKVLEDATLPRGDAEQIAFNNADNFCWYDSVLVVLANDPLGQRFAMASNDECEAVAV